MISNNKILLVYFSGTGNVKKIIDEFESQLLQRNLSVLKHSLDLSEVRQLKNDYVQILSNVNLIILLFPVHAFDAPVIVYRWIESLPQLENVAASVISVSGGGEVSLNKACRVNCIKALERKGIRVFYENMMVMPSNWVLPTADQLAIRLIRCIPEKTTKILNQILYGKRQRGKPKLHQKIMASYISSLEKWGTKSFGKGLKANSSCSGCAWCATNCPVDNIKMINNKPYFGGHCIMCFRCIYGCPQKSISATQCRFMIIKEGFSLGALEKRMPNVKLEPIEKYNAKLLWKAVATYLLGK